MKWTGRAVHQTAENCARNVGGRSQTQSWATWWLSKDVKDYSILRLSGLWRAIMKRKSIETDDTFLKLTRPIFFCWLQKSHHWFRSSSCVSLFFGKASLIGSLDYSFRLYCNWYSLIGIAYVLILFWRCRRLKQESVFGTATWGGCHWWHGTAYLFVVACFANSCNFCFASGFEKNSAESVHMAFSPLYNSMHHWTYQNTSLISH